MLKENDTSSEDEIDFYPKITILNQILEEVDWRGDPIVVDEFDNKS